MPQHPDLLPWTSSVGVVGCLELPLCATVEEVAFAAELADLDRADRECGEFYAADLDELSAMDVDWPSDDDLVIAMRGQVHEVDLMVLASIDPASLSSQRLRVDYVQAVDRVIARAASLRHTAEVALVGETAGPEHLSEVHVEHEIAVARHTSRHAAGAEIAIARRLATVFPGFAAALHDGQVSEAHCAMLVAKTRHVSDLEVLTRIEDRVLPRARRTTT
jgi:hypothetical protein